MKRFFLIFLLALAGFIVVGYLYALGYTDPRNYPPFLYDFLFTDVLVMVALVVSLWKGRR